MIDYYLNLFDEYILMRDKVLKGVTYKNEQDKFILTFHARMNSISNEILFLIKNNRNNSCEILLRSVLETFADLRCLIDDPSYIKVIYQDQRKGDINYYRYYSSENPYYGELTQAEADEKFKKLEIKKDKDSILSIENKFEKAKMDDAYRTIYAALCDHTHGNWSALARRNFKNGNVIYQKKLTKQELNFILSATINLAIASTVELLTYFDFNNKDIIPFKRLLDKNKKQAKTFCQSV